MEKFGSLLACELLLSGSTTTTTNSQNGKFKSFAVSCRTVVGFMLIKCGREAESLRRQKSKFQKTEAMNLPLARCGMAIDDCTVSFVSKCRLRLWGRTLNLNAENAISISPQALLLAVELLH